MTDIRASWRPDYNLAVRVAREPIAAGVEDNSGRASEVKPQCAPSA